MVKVLTLLGICLIIIGVIGICDHYYNEVEEVEDDMEEVYQGPVPQGYDLEHFRETGETIKEVEN